MSQVTIEVDEVVTKEIAKRDRAIIRLKDKLEKAEERIKRYQARYKALDHLRKTIIETAYTIDDYYMED